MSTLGAQTSLYAGGRGLQMPMSPGACLSQPLGVGVDSLVFIHLIPRIDHKIRMVINRLNHQSSI